MNKHNFAVISQGNDSHSTRMTHDVAMPQRTVRQANRGVFHREVVAAPDHTRIKDGLSETILWQRVVLDGRLGSLRLVASTPRTDEVIVKNRRDITDGRIVDVRCVAVSCRRDKLRRVEVLHMP